MSFWDNLGKFRDRGNADPENTEQKADENIESSKSKREEFIESLKVDVNDSDDIAEKDMDDTYEGYDDTDDVDDVDDDMDDIDNDIDRDGPEPTPEKTVDDDDDMVR